MFFSCGKDSLALLDLMAGHFKEIVCVLMYFVKDLEHINRYLVWAKNKYPNVKIEQVPHWNLSYLLRAGIYCVANPNVRAIKLADVDHAIRLKHGVNYSFFGMKKADGMHRRLMLKSYGDFPMSNTNKVYPLSDWSNKEVLSYISYKGLPMPIRYSPKASGGVGFNLECFLWLRENKPSDLQKILHAFPMSEKILWDYDYQTQQIV